MATMMSDDFILEVPDADSFKMWQGLVGPYYIPYVDGAGNLSWTNTGDLANPATVNVTGRGLTIVGIVESVEDLPEAANEFDVYLVGSDEVYHAYIFSENEWTDVGLVGRGEKGDQGDPGEGVPVGGTTGQVLKKASNTNYDTEWGSVEALPTGGTTGQVLAKASGADYDTEWVDQSGAVLTVNSVTPDQNGDVLITADDIETDSNQSIQDALDNIVHVGTSAPSDPSVKIWLDTDEPGMSGVSSVNGMTGTVVIDTVPMTLLWTNASPTSTFAAQTVQIDLSAYDFVMIEMKSSTTSDAYFTFIGESVVGHKGFIQKVVNLSGGTGVAGIERQFTLVASGVDFTRAFNYVGNATVNEEMIPFKIYGIKKT